MNGQDAVNVSVTKQSDANTVDTAKNVQDKLLDVQKSYPNLNLTVNRRKAGSFGNGLGSPCSAMWTKVTPSGRRKVA